ncbi:Glutathione synthetase, chloroplastic [Zea mays]|uniref:Glutathione synthetase n=1 Tax=Zea mays TaxID=4577 RepID=A0A3L6G172_MAIZE|nr:Glutathione synthetase, chloroplastic [Zea mays]
MSSPCVSHQQQVRLRLRAASRLPAPDTASFAPPAPRRLRVAHAAMSAKAPLGVAPAEEGAGTPGQQAVLGQMVEDAAVWCAVHGLVVGDRANQRSGTVPGVGLVHAPFSLLPARFPASFFNQACELAPIFNELVDRVSLDGEFLQAALSRQVLNSIHWILLVNSGLSFSNFRTKQVDEFTSRLLEIHDKMMSINKKEDIRLGLHRSDYMLDSETNSLLQIELNTIASSFPGLGSLVSELHRTLLKQYGKVLGLDPKRIPQNWAATQFAEALGRAWAEYNNDSAVVLMVVQPEERNMYDQYCLVNHLKESYPFLCLLSFQFSLLLDGRTVAVVYFRAGYAPTDYPSEAEWRARLLMEQSSAVKCPSIAYHLVGTKKIQQELAKPNVLERFLDNKDDIAKLRKSFAGLWSLDNEEIVRSAIQKPNLFVLKPQREGGGNNIYGQDLQDTLIKLQKEQGEALAAYILMQRIFPKASLTPLVRGGDCFEDLTISELGIYGAYLRNRDKVILNNQSGYLMRTKVSSSNEGGVAAGFAVLDSVLLTDEVVTVSETRLL